MIDENVAPDLPVDSKNRILHAAEKELTTRGFDGASTRDIAAAAGVAQALIHYHFTSKRALYLAMVQRRAHISNLAWESALAELPAPELEGILEAMFRPVIEDKSGGRAYLKVLEMLAKGMPEDQALLTTLFDPTAILFVEAIILAAPDLTHTEAWNGYRFALGVLLSLLMASERKKRLMGLIGDEADEHNIREAVAFCAAGIRALTQRSADA
jgi:AcrR family transcriptional regulator